MTDAKKTRPPRFLLQMRDDLRAALEKAALANGRNLTQEINTRLRESVNAPGAPGAAPTPPAPYIASNLATLHLAKDNGPAPAANDLDRAMLDVFHKLPVEKQLALLSLFK